MTDVLFQSDYWFASTYSQRVETIQNFIEEDSQRTLIIIDNAGTDVKVIIDILNKEWQLVFLRLVIGNPDDLEIHEYNLNDGPCNKTIYVLKSLDKMSLNLIERLTPILAIFV